MASTAVETQTPDIQTSDFRTILGLRKEPAPSWSERISAITHPLASKIRENFPSIVKEVAINGTVGLAAGSIARIALAGTGVGWIGAAVGGMVAGAAVEAVRELRVHQSLDGKKLAFAGIKGFASGLIGFEAFGLLGQTGWGSAIGSVVSEKFSGLGCNFHNGIDSGGDSADGILKAIADDKTPSFGYKIDYCDNPLAGMDIAALGHPSLPVEVAPALSSELLGEQTFMETIQSNIQTFTQDVLSTGDHLVNGLSEIGTNATNLVQEKWQEVSSILAPDATQARAAIDLPTSQPEQLVYHSVTADLPRVAVDYPTISADTSFSAGPHPHLVDYTFDRADQYLGDHSSLLGAADYDAARNILLAHQGINLDLVDGVASIDGEQLNRFQLYDWVKFNFEAEHAHMTNSFMGIMREATARAYGHDFLIPTEDGKDFLVPHVMPDEQKFVLKRVAVGIANRYFG